MIISNTELQMPQLAGWQQILNRVHDQLHQAETEANRREHAARAMQARAGQLDKSHALLGEVTTPWTAVQSARSATLARAETTILETETRIADEEQVVRSWIAKAGQCAQNLAKWDSR
jgi:hypothetical protein